MALADPFNMDQEVCSPFGYPIKTQKVKSFTKFEFECGTTGYGFVLIKYACASDVGTISGTSATSVGGASTILSSFTNTVEHTWTGMPFSSSDYGGTLSSRVNAGGIKIWSIDNGMVRDGMLHPFCESDNESVELMTFNSIVESNFSDDIPVPMGTEHVETSSCLPGLTNAKDGELQEGSPGIFPLTNKYFMGILIKAHAGAKFYAYACQHSEHSGTIANSKTPNDPDPLQGNLALAAAKTIAGTKGALTQKDAPSLWEKFKTSIAQHMPLIFDGVKTLGSMAVAAISRNPQAIGFAANSAMNMITSGQKGDYVPRLTQRQQGVLEQTKDHRKVDLAEEPNYFTIWDILYQDMFTFEPATVQTPASEGDQTYWMVPIPISSKFVPIKNSDEVTGRNAEMLQAILDINLYYWQMLTSPNLEQYGMILTRAQGLLDLYANQTPPEPIEVREKKRKVKNEKQKLREFYLQIPPTGWAILTEGGHNAFHAYILMNYGEEMASLHKLYSNFDLKAKPSDILDQFKVEVMKPKPVTRNRVGK
jgi:hypothetical protein